MDFKGKTVIVTGAAGNLGRAVAQAFSAQGANLVLADLNRDSLERSFGADSAQSMLAPVNLLDSDAVSSMAQQVQQRFGSIDVLCNIAGGFRMGPPVHATPDADWNFLFDLNTRSLLHAVRAVVPHMLANGSGKIVSVAATAALKGGAYKGAYSAAKDVVVRLTESMAAELGDSNINVNCVLPSIIDTPANRADMPAADFTRWVAPAALADVMLFLASDAARAIHGAALPVSGRS